MAKKDLVIQSDNKQNKVFSYTVGNTQLGFTLRTDIKGELKNFRSLLERAIVDIDKELEGLK